uniref:Uncharacterized protein n=1 Tax=Aegilops tauschii subsp. strangulata TaxID=200361 RepID=A0A453TD42_AEGTS
MQPCNVTQNTCRVQGVVLILACDRNISVSALQIWTSCSPWWFTKLELLLWLA